MPSFTRVTLGPVELGHAFRRELGRYLRGLRLETGLTQVQVAKAVGVEAGTTISGMELGRITPPVERYADLAELYEVPAKEFFRHILRRTNPWGHAMLYAPDPKAAIVKLNRQFMGE